MRITREQAALLLGVDPDASPEQVNHAWRVWAKLAHPDAGGDREHFEALAQARAVLTRGGQQASRLTHQEATSTAPAPRTPLRQVCCRPNARRAFVLAMVVLGAILIAVLAAHSSDLGAAVAVGIAASSIAITIQRTVLTGKADTGHRITVLTVAWLPMAALLSGIVVLQGAAIVGFLPVVALPFVVTVGLVNPGAGLWRPVRLPS